jgi:hypothetical protein
MQWVETRTILSVRLYLSGNEPPLNVDAAIVRWSTGRKLGLEFIRLGADEHHRLKHYLAGLA